MRLFLHFSFVNFDVCVLSALVCFCFCFVLCVFLNFKSPGPWYAWPISEFICLQGVPSLKPLHQSTHGSFFQVQRRITAASADSCRHPFFGSENSTSSCHPFCDSSFFPQTKIDLGKVLNQQHHNGKAHLIAPHDFLAARPSPLHFHDLWLHLLEVEIQTAPTQVAKGWEGLNGCTVCQIGRTPMISHDPTCLSLSFTDSVRLKCGSSIFERWVFQKVTI